MPRPAGRRHDSWIMRLQLSDETLWRQIRRRQAAERTIDQARTQFGLPPVFSSLRRGRPLVTKHPFPRRGPTLDEKMRNLLSDSLTHKSTHRQVYVEGCFNCYQREYLYFRKHPELRPAGTITAGAEQGMSKYRKWVTPNWPVVEARKAAEAADGEARRALADAREAKKKKQRRLPWL